MQSTTFDHCTICTTDLDGTCRFYEEVLGLIVGERPNFPFPGVWLYNVPPHDGVPLIHVIDEGPSRTRSPGAEEGGNVDHIAFRIADFSRLATSWEKWGIALPLGRCFGQLFVRDPNDIIVEIIYGIRDRTASPASSGLAG